MGVNAPKGISGRASITISRTMTRETSDRSCYYMSVRIFTCLVLLEYYSTIAMCLMTVFCNVIVLMFFHLVCENLFYVKLIAVTYNLMFESYLFLHAI